eukprot:1380088-Amorphochlora_amoeboformis.AAC.1
MRETIDIWGVWIMTIKKGKSPDSSQEFSRNILTSRNQVHGSPMTTGYTCTTGYCRLLPDDTISKNLRNLQKSLAICSMRTAILQHVTDIYSSNWIPLYYWH